MVEKPAPHEYFEILNRRGGSRDLEKNIARVDHECRQNNVQPIYTLNHLSVISRIPYSGTKDILLDHPKYYEVRKISKRSNSGYRKIFAPRFPLKQLQRTILKNCLPSFSGSNVSYGFQKGSSVAGACEQHIGARAMIKLDISNFYDSISTSSIYSVFKRLGYPELLAFEMGLLCSVGHWVELRSFGQAGYLYKMKRPGRLAQGSPASGSLSNIYCRRLDNDLALIARNNGAVVTRYADDMAFSFRKPLDQSKIDSILGSTIYALRKSGFELNRNKTQIIKNSHSFNLLGLRVDDSGIHLNSNYKRTVLDHLEQASHHGLSNYSAQLGYTSDLEFIFMLWGHYAHAAGVEHDFADRVRGKLAKLKVPQFMV